MKRAVLLLAAFAAAAVAAEPGPCASTLDDLRLLAGDRTFPLRWTETTMTDGKPLVVSISEHDQALFLRFRKSGEGLWAQGPARVCQGERALQARIPGRRLELGPAAHWLLRLSARDGATFGMARLASGLLRVSTPGWSGVFAPADEPASAALETPAVPR